MSTGEKCSKMHAACALHDHFGSFNLIILLFFGVVVAVPVVVS